MTIYLTVAQGARWRDMVRLGVAGHLAEMADHPIKLLTPAHREAALIREAEAIPDVSLAPLTAPPLTRQINLWRAVRDKLLRTPALLDQAWRFERPLLPVYDYDTLFEAEPPALVVLSDPKDRADWSVAIAARRHGVPVVGLLRSWDHLFKGMRARVDALGVWNPANQQEATTLQRYPPARVHLTGPVQFDPYFEPGILRPRDTFLASLGLDPDKKTIMLGTAGDNYGFAQAWWMDAMLAARDAGRFAMPVQFICRTHPADRMIQFMKYLDNPDVVLGYYKEASPTLIWLIDREGIARQANMIAHSDVLLTPASTLTLEAAIFDTPTLILAFNDADPGGLVERLHTHTFSWHFKPLVARDLLPVVYDLDSMVDWINRYLEDPSLYRQARQTLVDEWVYFTDGQSARRVAAFIMEHLP